MWYEATLYACCPSGTLMKRRYFISRPYADKWILQSKYGMKSQTWFQSHAIFLSLTMEEVTHAYQRAKFDVPLLGPRQNGNRTPWGDFYEQGVPRNGLTVYWLLDKCSLPCIWGRRTFNSITEVKSLRTGISSLVHTGEAETTFSLPWHWILKNWNLFHFVDLNQSGISCPHNETKYAGI